MLSLTFTSARQTTFGRAGIDILYFYKRSDSEETYKIHVVGSELSWEMNEQEKYDYAQLLFAGAISYIKKYWLEKKELPDGETEIHDRLDFTTKSQERTAWEGYVLDLA